MMSRPVLDQAKAMAEKRTGIPASQMLISAVHAHSAPSSMGCLGTDADPAYVPFLQDKLVEAVAAAQAALEPARAGFAKAKAAEFTALRRWIRRPDRLAEDPFGNKTVRANMHAGRIWDDVTGESGPEDPDLALISIQASDGRPLAVLANFSMHYFGDQDISPDYYGLFCDGLKQRLALSSGRKRPLCGHHVARLQRRHLATRLHQAGERVECEAFDRVCQRPGRDRHRRPAGNSLSRRRGPGDGRAP